jgi:MoCo/4Fe-4S cofactor protein with predicted Tat translocation signal
MGNKKYWKSLEDLNDSKELIKQSQNEFAEPIPMDKFLSGEAIDSNGTNRRDFLKFLGFSVTAATLAACETPVRKVVPYVVKPEEITVGVSNWYASTFSDGHDYCEVLVKTREGRPVKIEGNKKSLITQGATNHRTQASILNLYDDARFKNPLKDGKDTTWQELDKEVVQNLANIAASGGQIRVLTSTNASPSTKQILNDFVAKYPSTKVVTYDAISYYSIIEANRTSFAKAVIPTYKFQNANVVVSFGADFLNSWISPIENAKQYGANRKVSKEKNTMCRHYQFEAVMSLTGANADYRVGLKPSEQNTALVNLYNQIAGMAGASKVSSKSLSSDKTIAKAAHDLWANKGKSLVVCGSNNTHAQVICNAINSLLGNYGNTIDLDNYSNLYQGNDTEFDALVKEMKQGIVKALFVYNCNPVYSAPKNLGFEEAIKKVSLSVSFSDRNDETTKLCKYVAITPHFLESWGDSNPRIGHYSLTQPTIYPIFNSRAMQQSLLAWSGNSSEYSVYLKEYWQKSVFAMQSEDTFYDNWWMKSLHDGIRVFGSMAATTVSFAGDINTAASAISKELQGVGAFEVTFFENALGNGSMANNPWLQELPDSVSKVVWDNYVSMSPKQMIALGLTVEREQEVEADCVDVTINGQSFNLPVYPQPGQPEGTIGIALGYGRTIGGKVIENNDYTTGKKIIGGVNVFSATSFVDGAIQYNSFKVDVKKSSNTYMLVSTQSHHTMMGRHMVKETSLKAWQKDKTAGNHKELFKIKEHGHHKEKTAKELDLWATKEQPGFDRPGHFWNMNIDLNSCIGCGNCIVACQSENNVSVVGKDEVRKSREMHWMRIDRYYSSDRAHSRKPEDGKITMYHELEVPSENPQVLFQPVMCMHCNHAPCETVCPVIATTHSSEGLNQMTYNRCVGTKYCANNCPYKVRRFNWFKYHNNAQFDFNTNSELGKLVLNPDVTVRSRGVMEKCSMCVQRIQEGKLTAKRESRTLVDGEINTACASSCPTNAITFGDANDKNSMVSKMNNDERTYILLEEINTQPSVFYQTKLRNTDEEVSHHA